MKKFIKENCLIVSDREIAIKFGVSVGGVSVARRRMGLKKTKEQAREFRNKVDAQRPWGSSTREGRSGGDFRNFWNG